jgi:hypothetical protein
MDGPDRDTFALLPVFVLALLSPFLYDVWSQFGG